MENDFKTSDGQPVKNAGVISYLSSLLAERGRRGQEILLQYIKGHSGDPGNDGADAQASIGATLPPRPELDWDAMKSRANDLIESLIPKQTSESLIPNQTSEVSVYSTVQTQSSETSERPKKVLKNHAIVTRASSTASYVPTHISVPVAQVTPILPSHSPLRSIKTSASSLDRLTVYSRSPRPEISTPESSAVPLMQPPLLESQSPSTSVSRSSEIPDATRTPTSTGTHAQNSQTRINDLPPPPKSPLKVSKVAPPLVPVSMSDIDLDVSSISCQEALEPLLKIGSTSCIRIAYLKAKIGSERLNRCSHF